MNLANAVTLLRILLLPFFLAILLSTKEIGNIGVFMFFVILAISDAVDGIVARSLHQVSKIGTIFDPIADKLLVTFAFLGLLAKGSVSVWPVALILTREFLVLGLRIVDASEVGKILAAEKLGKVKTVLQLVAIGWLLLGWQGGEALLWVSVFLTWWSGIDYGMKYLRAK